MIMKYKIRNQ